MDVSHDHVGHSLASPLRSHMANTLNSGENKAIVGLGVTADLTVGVPWSPGVNNGPAELLHPHLGAEGGDGTIGISRVEHKSSLVLENAIDPHGCLILHVVVKSGRALLPSLNLFGNVEGSSDILS